MSGAVFGSLVHPEVGVRDTILMDSDDPYDSEMDCCDQGEWDALEPSRAPVRKKGINDFIASFFEETKGGNETIKAAARPPLGIGALGKFLECNPRDYPTAKGAEGTVQPNEHREVVRGILIKASLANQRANEAKKRNEDDITKVLNGRHAATARKQKKKHPMAVVMPDVKHQLNELRAHGNHLSKRLSKRLFLKSAFLGVFMIKLPYFIEFPYFFWAWAASRRRGRNMKQIFCITV